MMVFWSEANIEWCLLCAFLPASPALNGRRANLVA